MALDNVKPLGIWCLVTTDGISLDFYEGWPHTNPLVSNPSFESEDKSGWIIDAGRNNDIKARYPVFPEDDSFVIIPKQEIALVFFKDWSSYYFSI